MISVLAFAIAGRRSDSAQLSTICGLLIGTFDKGSIYHTISWTSHKSKRPVKSIAAGENFAAGEGIEEGLVLKKYTYSLLLNVDTELFIVLTPGIFILHWQRNASQSIVPCVDIYYFRCQFEDSNANHIFWIPGRLILADPGTNSDSSLKQALQLLLCSGKRPSSFSEFDATNSKEKPLG